MPHPLSRMPRAKRHRSSQPQPALHAKPSTAKIVRARISLWVCVAFWMLYMVSAIVTLADGSAFRSPWEFIATALFLIAVTLLTFSASMYLLARTGAFVRFAHHQRARRIELDDAFAAGAPRLVALLPSYDEDPALVRMALWSTGLQEYPGLAVVLLIDDDPETADPAKREALEQTRMLAAELTSAVHPQRTRIATATALLAAQMDAAAPGTRAEIVAGEYTAAAQWLSSRAAAEPRTTHVEEFFADQVLSALAESLGAVAAALQDSPDSPQLTPERCLQLLQRLDRIFDVTATSFERKRYANLSHDPNKAMNINSYLSLLGGSYEIRDAAGSRILIPAAGEPAAGAQLIEIPDYDYVLTLDADSMLLPEYCLRLVRELEREQNARVAVAQTPYSAYRGATSLLERLAGATTDLQHIAHQGLSRYRATFWVGANAILRRSALDDIRTETHEDGKTVVRYISDRTAIEDTESSIDLAEKGWSLLSYPERLSYSATPPDFGALAIQRRRWADGGLLILPRLHALIAHRRGTSTPLTLTERMLRFNYLGSIAWTTLGLLVVLFVRPVDGKLITLSLALIALPYFVEMASDLHYLGYRRIDVIRIYGLNLLLIAVNLSGTLASIAQAFSGIRARFARTPKVKTRTAAPALLLLAPLGIVVAALAVTARSVYTGSWGSAVFAALTGVCTLWALIRLVHIGAFFRDVWFGWLDWIWVPRKPKPEKAGASAAAPAEPSDALAIIDDGYPTATEAAR